MTDDAQSDSQGSGNEYPFNKLKKSHVGISGRRHDAESHESSSDDGQNTGWRSGQTEKMRAHKLKKKNYFVTGHADESEDEANRHGLHSNGSSSNDSKVNWNLGYRPLPDSDEEKSSGPRREQRSYSKPILQPKGRGHKALDSSHEGDTDEEDDDAPAGRISARVSGPFCEEDEDGSRRGAMLESDNHRMKPILTI